MTTRNDFPCWCGHMESEHGHDGECQECECAMYDEAQPEGVRSEREDFHSDEALGSVDSEPYFPYE